MLAHPGAPSTAQRDDEQEAEQWRARQNRVQREPVRRPVGREDLADQLLARNRAPAARVARLIAVVAHEEVLALRHRPGTGGGITRTAILLDVRIVEPLAVDVDESALLLRDRLARKADQALDES